jgi:hypothetical protein
MSRNSWIDDTFKGLSIAGNMIPLIPIFITGIQHLKPGTSGDEKKAAVINLVLAGGQAAAIASPENAALAGNLSQTVGGLVQYFYDQVKANQPQALLVHPENTAPAGDDSAAPAPAPPAAPSAT